MITLYSEQRTPTRKLQKLAQEVDVILREDLQKYDLMHAFAEVRIMDCKTVGVQGDERTYGFPAEITLYDGEKFVWGGRAESLERLSNRITNEVRGVNRVIYTLARNRSL